MSWSNATQDKLYDTRAGVELKRFLSNAIPPFVAPTNPARWRREAARMRGRALESVYLRGFPRKTIEAFPKIVWGGTLRPDPSYCIRKLRYQIYPDYWIPALLYEPTGLKDRAPVVLNPNGHHSGGKAVEYKQIRCANLARRGVLALNIEFIGMGELSTDENHLRIAHLNLTGLSGVGLFYLALKKGLDVLLAHKHADRRRVAVTGLSGGGWQTIVISALDPRVTLSVPVAGYTSIRARMNVQADIGDLEQAPVDMTTALDYQHLTAMLAPRPALLLLNENDDCCFATARAKPVIFDAVKPTYAAFGAAGNFETHSNFDPGTHNYDADNRAQFYRFLKKHFKMPGPEADIHLPCDILTESRLNVGLPPGQKTFVGIALERARALAPKRRMPKTAADRRALRKRIADCLRLPEYAVKRDTEMCRTGRMSKHILAVGPWSVPAAAFSPASSSEAELRIADVGRGTFAGNAPDGSRHVLAADIFGTGENECSWQLQMLLESSGSRVLGVQVAQVLACASHLRKSAGTQRIHVDARGAKASFAALAAAALRPDLFKSLTMYGNVPALIRLLELGASYDSHLPLFCFGLLEIADAPELMALLEDVPVSQPGRYVPVENQRISMQSP